MSNKILSLVLITVLLTGIAASNAYCDDALKKLGRGAANCVTFPVEIIEQVKRVNNSDGATAAFTYGIMKGVGMMVVRALVGVYEVATFPIPLPKNYEPILKDPEFFCEDMNW
jgi:putative exosortase-associated protein (TIGR04073 family)